MNQQIASALLVATCALAAQAQSQSDAFNQGATLGRAGNAAARAQINGSTAQSNVPGYTASPPQTSYFGGAGITAPASAAAHTCTDIGGPGNGSAGSFAAQDCNAIDFSQTNATRRPSFQLTQDDPLLTGARPITADPQAIAGNIAGTYSACQVQTTTTPDRFETALCHQFRATETLTCDKVLVVTPSVAAVCNEGQFLTHITADPCPACIDYLAFDFSCRFNNYLMHVYTIEKTTGQVYMEMAEQVVAATLNTQISQTAGPYQMDSEFCYQTYYSQSCSGTTCTIGAWFVNPCRQISYQGQNTFPIPGAVSFTDSWVNQCTALEARSQ